MWLMYSTADSKRSATDSKLFAGDILPKTQAQWKKNIFNKCSKGSEEHQLGCTSLEVWLLCCQNSETTQPSQCLPPSLV